MHLLGRRPGGAELINPGDGPAQGASRGGVELFASIVVHSQKPAEHGFRCSLFVSGNLAGRHRQHSRKLLVGRKRKGGDQIIF